MYDLDHNVEFNGVYQSMTKQAAITVQVRLILFYFFVPVMLFSTLSCVSLVLSPFYLLFFLLFFFLKGFYLDSKTLLMFG